MKNTLKLVEIHKRKSIELKYIPEIVKIHFDKDNKKAMEDILKAFTQCQFDTHSSDNDFKQYYNIDVRYDRIDNIHLIIKDKELDNRINIFVDNNGKEEKFTIKSFYNFIKSHGTDRDLIIATYKYYSYDNVKVYVNEFNGYINIYITFNTESEDMLWIIY